MKKRACLLADQNRGLQKQEVADMEGKGITSPGRVLEGTGEKEHSMRLESWTSNRMSPILTGEKKGK